MTLTPGTYIYFCDAHTTMKGQLVVGPTLKLNILSTTAARKKIVVKAKANQLSHFVGHLYDKLTMTEITTTVVPVQKDGTTVSLTLKPLVKLTPGKYVVEVDATAGSASIFKKKTVRVY